MVPLLRESHLRPVHDQLVPLDRLLPRDVGEGVDRLPRVQPQEDESVLGDSFLALPLVLVIHTLDHLLARNFSTFDLFEVLCGNHPILFDDEM